MDFFYEKIEINHTSGFMYWVILLLYIIKLKILTYFEIFTFMVVIGTYVVPMSLN